MMSPLFLAVLLRAPTVVGTSVCPTPEAVRQAFGPAASGSPEKPTTARLTPEGRGLRIDLLDGRGQLRATKTLPELADCRELAKVVSLVLAAWESEFAPPALTPIGLELAPAPAVASLGVSPQPGPLSPFRWRLGAAPLLSETSSGPALAGLFSTEVIHRSSGIGAQLSLSAETQREIPLGVGSVGWNRWALGAGPLLAFSIGQLELTVHADALLALVVARGQGFSASSTSTAIDVGLRAGLGLGWPLGRLQPWLGAYGLWWPARDLPQVSGIFASTVLPRAELTAGPGLNFDLF